LGGDELDQRAGKLGDLRARYLGQGWVIGMRARLGLGDRG
jgi:hypothetical protein